MEILKAWYKRMVCRHVDAVTLRKDDHVHKQYCKTCDTWIVRNNQKWWQR